MSNTRFNYDESRTRKRLQESTATGRRLLNTPNVGCIDYFYTDPHIRLQKWGANLCKEHPIDILNELQGRNSKLTRYGRVSKGIETTQNSYSNMNSFTNETRTTHPAYMYRNTEHTRWNFPLQNPIIETRSEGKSSRLIQKNNFVPNNIWKH
jgi:hypothetical protein